MHRYADRLIELQWEHRVIELAVAGVSGAVSLPMIALRVKIPTMYHGDHISPLRPLIVREPRLAQAHYMVAAVNGYPLSNALDVQVVGDVLKVTAHNISGQTIPETVVDILLVRLSTAEPIYPAAS